MRFSKKVDTLVYMIKWTDCSMHHKHWIWVRLLNEVNRLLFLVKWMSEQMWPSIFCFLLSDNHLDIRRKKRKRDSGVSLSTKGSRVAQNDWNAIRSCFVNIYTLFLRMIEIDYWSKLISNTVLLAHCRYNDYNETCQTMETKWENYQKQFRVETNSLSIPTLTRHPVLLFCVFHSRFRNVTY